MSPEEAHLVATANALADLRSECVFVGGAILCVYVRGAPPPRATADVDIVVPVDSAVAYELDVAQRLRRLGWSEDTTEGAPRCRWRHPTAGVLDAMPISDADFGFANRWYPEVVRTAQTVSLGGLDLRVASLPTFMATKVEAFLSRGHSDWASSHDLEDVLTLLSSCDDVVARVDEAGSEVRTFLRDTFADWLRPPSVPLLVDGEELLIDGLPLLIEDTSPLVDHARGHFSGNADGERAANRAIERMRGIAALE